MFISEEVELLSRQYKTLPFGNKKDKRIESWLNVFNDLPEIKEAKIHLTDEVTVDFRSDQDNEMEELFLQLMPWRKGPFRINDIFIDSEWDSARKWKRFQELSLDLSGKSILDVGSGNGYYAFRMLGMGANQVLCLEPNLMHVSQFTAVNHFIGTENIRMVPERLEHAGLKDTRFDLIFSMGLLYHQRNPKEHLLKLIGLLKNEGKLILETIIAPEEYGLALVPEDGRYASMPNVHYVHTHRGCSSIFEELNLKLIAETDLVATNLTEQRKTKWMPFKSFESALKEEDKSVTVEGYPAPQRKFYILQKTH